MHAENTSNIEESDNDADLVAQCCQQLPYRTKAYEQLVQKYRTVVLTTCYRLLSDIHEAEEAAQDVWLRVFHKITTFQSRASFRTWLFRIVHNVCYNKLEKIRRRNRFIVHTEKIEHLPPELIAEQPIDQNTPTDVIETLRDAFTHLSVDEREILTLRYISELKINEIANVLDLGESAVKMRIQRATDTLRNVYNRITQQSPSETNPKHKPPINFFRNIITLIL